MNPSGIIFVAIGVFSLVCAIGDWDWFMNSHKAKFVTKMLGRTGARFFYGFLGLCLVGFGLLASFGMIDFLE